MYDVLCILCIRLVLCTCVYLYHNELVARYELLILYAYMHVVYVIYESYVCCVHSRKISKKYSY